MDRKTKFPEPLVISLRKSEIYARREGREEVSSLYEAHELLLEADPDLTETAERARNNLLKYSKE